MSKTITKAQYKLSSRKGELALQAGQANTHKAASGEAYRILKRQEDANEDALAGDVVAQRSGADLQLDYADGTQLTLQDYFTECKTGPGCEVTLAGDSSDGWQLTAAAKDGAGLADGSSLLYAHGSTEALAGMVPSHQGLEQPLAGLKGDLITYIPQDHVGTAWLAGGAGLAGLLALGGGGGGGGESAPPAPSVQNHVQLNFMGGPALSGNDLSIEVYSADGKTLIGKAKLNADGSVTVDVKDYVGVVIVKLINNGSASDYLDEATGLGKDLSAQLYTMGVITEPNSTISLNVNVLTTIAYAKAQEAAGGSSANPVALGSQQVVDTAAAISKVFQVDDVLHTPAIATNGGNYDAANGLSSGEKYGAVLAAFSGAEQMGAHTVQQVLDTVLAGISVHGNTAVITNAAQAVLVEGAEVAVPGASADDPSGGVSPIIDTYAPEFTSGATAAAIAENSGAGQVVYTATASDPSAIRYSLAGADAAAFSIDALTGKVTLTGNPDYETKSSYNFSVVATDAAGNKSQQSVTLAVNDVDENAPVFTSGSTATAAAIAENSGAGQLVYTAAATDASPFSFSLAGADAAAFSIDAATGKVTLTGNPDYEAKSSYSFSVVATDALGNTSQQAVTLAVNDVDENAPVFTSGSTATAAAIAENSGAGQVVYTAAATDASRFSFSLAGADAAAFSIDALTGKVTLTGNPDYETKSSYSFRVVATDALGNKSQQAVTLAVNDVDENAPVFTAGSTATAAAIAENSGAGQVVYTAAATDASRFSFSLAGADAAAFSIDAATGKVTLTGNPDYETKSSYSFSVVATDAAGNTSEQAVTLAVNDVDDTAPQVNSIAISAAVGIQNQTLNAGDVVSVTVTMSEATLVTGKPQLALRVGNSIVYADYDSGSGSSSLVFKYTIQAGQTDANGISITANSLALNGGTLKDVAGNAAGLSHAPVTDQSDYKVDTTAPTATLGTGSSVVTLEGVGKTNGLDRGPQVTAVGTDGSYVVVWFGEHANSPSAQWPGGEETSIFVQKFNADGTKASASPIQLEPFDRANGMDSMPQVMALGKDGSFVVAWAGQDGEGDRSIYVQKFNADGSPAGAMEKLEAPKLPVGDDNAPQLAQLADGSFVVTWSGYDSSLNSPHDTSIFVQKFNADGSKSSAPVVQLELPGKTNGNELAPQVQALADGSFVVTFHGKDSGNNDRIVVQKFNADGTTTGHAMQVLHGTAILSPYDFTPQVSALGSDGSFVVTWYGRNNSSQESIFVQKFDASGAATGSMAELKPLDYPAGSNQLQQVTSLGKDGSFVVAWSGQDGNGSAFGIYVQKFNADGSVGSNTLVKLGGPGAQFNSRDTDPQVTALSNGSYVVVWSGVGSNGTTSIFLQKFNADGTTTGHAQQQLDAPGKTNGSDVTPQVEALGTDGSFVVTWSGMDSGNDYSVFVQQFGADGKPIAVGGIPVRSSEAGTAYLVHSSIAVTNEASITAADSGLWKGMAVGAGVDAIMATSGLADGTYKLYTVDAAGNVSQPASGSTVIDRLPPTFTSGASAEVITENSGLNQIVYTAAATDASAVTFSLSGADAAAFTINAMTGAVTLKGNPDYEAKANYSFTVVATDALGRSSQQTVTLAIHDVDDTPPVFISGTTAAAIDESSGAGQVVYTAQATDDNTVSYSLTGADAAAFSIDAVTGKVTLTGNPDYETKAGYSFTVVATDALGNHSQQNVTLAINDGVDPVPPVVFLAGGVPQTVQLEAPGRTNSVDQSPSLAALGSDGSFVVAWQGWESSGSANDIYVQRFDADGKPVGAPAQLDSPGQPDSDVAPFVAAVGNNGAYVVGWQGNEGSGIFADANVYVQRFDAHGNKLNPVLKFEAPGKTDGTDSGVHIKALGNAGDFLVSWSGQDAGGGDSSIFVQKVLADGTVVGTPTLLEATGNTSDTDHMQVVMTVGDDGAYVVAWRGVDAGETDGSIYVQYFDALGNPKAGGATKLEAPGYTQGSDITVQLAPLGNSGAFVAVWQGAESATETSVYVQRFDSTGTPVDQPLMLEANGRTDGIDGAPVVASLGNAGAFVVAWHGQDSDASKDLSIFVQRFDPQGSKLGPAVQLEAPGRTDGADWVPQITVLGDSGAFVVTWYGQDSDAGKDTSIFVQKFNADGSLAGATVQLEALGRTDGSDTTPRIQAVGTEGEYVVTWAGQDSDAGKDYSIFVQKFKADGSPYAPELVLREDQNATVQSSAPGKVYLVHDSVSVHALADITGAADAHWNSVDIAVAHTNTALALGGLADGKYHAWAVDESGLLSKISGASIEVDATAPKFASGDAASVTENSGTGRVVYTAQASDARSVSYSLKAGVGDAANFSIKTSSGAVTLVGNPNFEAKASYQFTVLAVDAVGNVSEQQVTLAVGNVDDTAPIITSAANATVLENSGAGKVVYTITSDDSADASPGAIVYSLKAGVGDASSFTIDAATGQVVLTANPDYEVKKSYSFTVLATDAAGNVSSKAVTLAVGDVDEIAPTLVASTPADDASPVSIGVDVVLQFSEAVQAGSGHIRLVNAADPGDTRTIDIRDTSQVTINGSTVTINPAGDLKPDTQYHVEIDGTALRDATGNSYAGIASGDSSTLDFKTGTKTLFVTADGLFYDSDGSGGIDAGDQLLSLGVTGVVNGLSYGSQGQTIDLAGDAWTVQFLSVTGPKLDLTGFGSNDHVQVVMDERTVGDNQAMGLDLGPLSTTADYWSRSDEGEVKHFYGASAQTSGSDATLRVDVDMAGVRASYSGADGIGGNITLATGLGADFDFQNHVSYYYPEAV